MPTILPASSLVQNKLEKHNLKSKYQKTIDLLANNPRHPSLHVELLKPASSGIYSFRLDRKYRALFIFRPDLKAVEILTITVHYR